MASIARRADGKGTEKTGVDESCMMVNQRSGQ